MKVVKLIVASTMLITSFVFGNNKETKIDDLLIFKQSSFTPEQETIARLVKRSLWCKKEFKNYENNSEEQKEAISAVCKACVSINLETLMRLVDGFSLDEQKEAIAQYLEYRNKFIDLTRSKGR